MTVSTAPAPQAVSLRAWFVWSITALAFGYAFFHRVAPTVMVQDLMADFAINATILGTLSSLYFYPYVLMQVPLGVLIDRWGARLLLGIALSVAGLGSALFAMANTVELAYAGRVLIGIGSAVGFLGSLNIASSWFPQRYFAMLAGLVMLVGMMSGVFAQGPLAAIVETYGWRNALWGLGVAGFLIAALIVVFVRNTPDNTFADTKPKQSWSSMANSLKRAIVDWGVWKVAIVASTMSGPMLALGGLWATPYMEAAYGLETPTAASLVSVLFFAWALGAPLSGWMSDRIHKRRALLITGSAILTIAMGVLVFGPILPISATVILFAIIGMSGSAMAICFALVREGSSPEIGNSVTGIVNSMTVASGAILQPVIGFILDQLWDGKLEGGARIYLATEYQTAFVAVFVACAVGFAISLTLKETPVWDEKTE